MQENEEILFDTTFMCSTHCVKSVRIRSFSGLYFPAFGVNTKKCIYPYLVRMRKNTNQKNSEYGQFSRSDDIFDMLKIDLKV